VNQQPSRRTDASRRRLVAKALRRVLGVVLVAGATTGVILAMTSAPSVGGTLPGHGATDDGHRAGQGVERGDGTTTDAAPRLETGPGHPATFFEDFDTPAAAGGAFARTYADAWQPYAEGTSGKYWSDALVSAHDGVMDVAMDGHRGAAGVFGSSATAWGQVGGTYSIRMKVEGGDGNGTAIMLWPTSNDRSEGEINFPEGNFTAHPVVYHHSMMPGHESTSQRIDTHVSWRDWHTYSIVWKPGKSVSYYLDGDLLGTITTNVPVTPHRYTFQIGDTGGAGHVLIDWVSRSD
jgi:hypothetical protein